MRKVLLLLTITFFIFLNSVRAQIPGFEGHRFSVYYSGSLFVRLSNPTYVPDFGAAVLNPPGNIGINYRNNFDADYVVSRSTAVGVGFKLLNTATKETTIGSSNRDSYTYPFADMTTKFFSVYFKKFPFDRSGFIAPVGSYYKLELALGFTSVLGDTIKANYINLNTGNTTTSRIHGTLPGITTLTLFYTIGQQRIIAKRFYIDYGVDFGFPLTLIGKVLNSATDDEEVLNDAKYKEDVEERLFKHILFNLHIGTGILLF